MIGYLLLSFAAGLATPFIAEAVSKATGNYKAKKRAERIAEQKKQAEKMNKFYQSAYNAGALATLLTLAEQEQKKGKSQKAKRVHEVYVLNDDMTVKSYKATEFNA